MKSMVSLSTKSSFGEKNSPVALNVKKEEKQRNEE